MRVLGVDPGTIKMGLGVVDSISGDLNSPYHGLITPRRKDPLENRLAQLFEAVKKAIEENQPDAIAVEEPFVSKTLKQRLLSDRRKPSYLLQEHRRISQCLNMPHKQ